MCKIFNMFFHTLFMYITLLVYTASLFDSNSPVISLSASELSSMVSKDNNFFIVTFYADWCGHCQKFSPIYEEAARAFKGYIKLYGCKDEQAMGQFNVSGFPTIKAFIGAPNGKHQVIEFNAGRDTNSVVSYILTEFGKFIRQRQSGKKQKSKSKVSGDVITLTDANFEEKVLNDTENAWFVCFVAPWCGHCKALHPTWDTMASQIAGKVKVGRIDATTETSLAQKYQVKGFPTIKMFPAGKKIPSKVVDYVHGRGIDDLTEFALGYGVSDIELTELTSQDVYDEMCSSTVCMLAFLPHILDSSAKERNEQIKLLKDVAQAKTLLPVNVLYCQGGDQYDFEQSMNLSFGYPAVIAINNTKKVYTVHRGSFTTESLSGFLNGLMMGKVPLNTLPDNLPKLKTVSKWDGKDGVVEGDHSEL